jgi:hypothetical protein
MYREAATSSSSYLVDPPCQGRVFVSMDTLTRRFLSSVGGGPVVLIILCYKVVVRIYRIVRVRMAR